MRCCQLSLIVVALVVPFGLFERGGAAIDEIRLKLLQSCPDEIGDFSEAEAEAEELESYLQHVPSIEPPVQRASRLATLQISPVATIDVDPLGRRPPPSVRIS